MRVSDVLCYVHLFRILNAKHEIHNEISTNIYKF